jgi:glycosyltransferase involved in cell wall biosynthesis
MKEADLKICMVTFDFPPIPGGIANHVYELSRCLRRDGGEIHVLMPRWSRSEKENEIIAGIQIHRVYGNAFFKCRNPFFILRMQLKLKQLIKRFNFDIIHNHSFFYGGFVVYPFRKRAVVLTNHESGFLEFVDSWLLSRMLYVLMRPYRFIIAPSEELRAKTTWFGFPGGRTKFITNGVDEVRFSPSISGKFLRDKYGIKNDDLLVLCPRRLEPKNGVEFFIKSAPLLFNKAGNIKFMVVGGGFPEERARFESFIENAGFKDRVIFTGTIDNKKMPKVYAAADLVILPSLMEATSLSGLEAMATGKPLIGTKVGGIPYLIEDKRTGILIPPKNSRAISEAIYHLSSSSNARKTMGAAARKKVLESFSWSKVAKMTREVYDKVLKTH